MNMISLISKRFFHLTLLSVILLTGGCAAGNKYNYVAEDVGLPIKASSNTLVGVGAQDSRPYVLNGDKPAKFVGLQRGGFGNPFDVTTGSQRGFTDDLAGIVGKMLQKSDFSTALNTSFSSSDEFLAALKASGASRGVYIDVREWKTDIYAKITLHYDLELSVYDRNGEVLAQSLQQGKEPIGGASMSQSANARSASLALATKISYLFNDANVKAALQ
ncbi:hypothetical protein ACFO4O_07385 [Glaciecola siphonariae]|uniref:Lipoprotein n=1 Tax=Glaciecola siphonariae TaxID=521012 RepID=A0ABV9LTY9_9ALTE